MLKIYLAARYSRLNEMQSARAKLETAGHYVTSRWINGDHRALDAFLAAPLTTTIALDDKEDLDAATVLIAFTEEPRVESTRGGRHIETGYALGKGKTVIVVGPVENVFHSLPEVTVVDSLAAAMKVLG